MTKFVVRADTPYQCLTAGFDALKKRRGEMKTITTRAGEKLQRKCALVEVQSYSEVTGYEDIGEYWADQVTGTLYRTADGSCTSSDQVTMTV